VWRRLQDLCVCVFLSNLSKIHSRGPHSAAGKTKEKRRGRRGELRSGGGVLCFESRLELETRQKRGGGEKGPGRGWLCRREGEEKRQGPTTLVVLGVGWDGCPAAASSLGVGASSAFGFVQVDNARLVMCLQ
jgi:hypothetical protein